MPPNSSRRVSVFSFAPRIKSRRAEGRRELDEDICQGENAGRLAGDGALLRGDVRDGEAVSVGPTNLAPDELREACRAAVEGLGFDDAHDTRFRSAAEMVELWRGLDLPAGISPHALSDARLGYLNVYDQALVPGEPPIDQTALTARWGKRWKQKLDAARRRTGINPE